MVFADEFVNAGSDEIPKLSGVPTGSRSSKDFVKLSVETRILKPDPQDGMKSLHTAIFTVDQTSGKISASDTYETGTTDFFGHPLSSMRNNFSISNFEYSAAERYLKISMTGQTASGVGLIPNINYHFDIIFDLKDGFKIRVNGAHDGYPAYKITHINGHGKSSTVYDFKHKPKDIIRLFGESDVIVKI